MPARVNIQPPRFASGHNRKQRKRPARPLESPLHSSWEIHRSGVARGARTVTTLGRRGEPGTLGGELQRVRRAVRMSRHVEDRHHPGRGYYSGLRCYWPTLVRRYTTSMVFSWVPEGAREPMVTG